MHNPARRVPTVEAVLAVGVTCLVVGSMMVAGVGATTVETTQHSQSEGIPSAQTNPAGTGAPEPAQAQSEGPDPTVTDRRVSDDVVRLGESVTVTVAVRNDGARAGPWSTVSVSFPGLDDSGDRSQIEITDTSVDDYSGVVTAGETIRDRNDEELDADYALAEAGTSAGGSWAAGATQTLTVEVTPTETGRFPIYVRGTMTDADDVSARSNDPERSQARDQQGYPVYVQTVEVVDSLAASTDDATGVTQDGATMYGAIDDRGRDAPVDVGFEYREAGTDEWHESPDKTYTRPQEYKVEVDGLEPGTTYEYRAVVDNGAESAQGEVRTFTTTGEPERSPEVATTEVTSADTTSAVITGDLRDEGSDTPVEVWFEYRASGSDDWQRTSTTGYLSATDVRQEIDGLEPGTEYEYRVVAESESGMAEGEVRTVETLPGPPTAERVIPDEGETTVVTSESVDFTVEASAPGANLGYVEWYLDGKHVNTNEISGASETDSRTFSFEEPGTYDVAAETYSISDADGEEAWIPNDEGVYWTVHVEPETGELEATVLDEQGASVEGATVVLFTESWEDPDVDERTKETDTDGTVTWTGLTGDEYNLEAYVDGELWHTSSQAVTDETTSVELARNTPYVKGFDDAGAGEYAVGDRVTLVPQVANADWGDHRIEVTVSDEEGQTVDTFEGLSSGDQIVFTGESPGEYCLDARVEASVGENWTLTANESSVQCLTVSEEETSASSFDIEVGREETYTGSQVAMRIEDPRPDTEYEWRITDNEATGDLLHTSGEHTTLTVQEEGEYTVEVVGTAQDGSRTVGERVITAEDRIIDELDADVMELAKQYAPVLTFHHDEQFFPTRFEAYVENAEELETGNGPVEDPTLLDLADAGAEGGQIKPGTMNDQELLGFQDFDTYPRTVYVSNHSVTYDGEDYVALGYWMIYVHDPKPDDAGAPIDILAKHTGDQEPVFILLNESGPQWVAAQQHKGGEIRSWEQTARAGDQIQVYPAQGAHSNYLAPYSGNPAGESLAPASTEYDAQHLYQEQYYPAGATSTEIHSFAYDLSEYTDPIGNGETWAHTDSQNGEKGYELVLLTERMAWAAYEGDFYSYMDGGTGERTHIQSLGDIPMQQFRWENLGQWMQNNIAESHGQFDAQITETDGDDVEINRSTGVPEADITLANTGPQPGEFVVNVTTTHESGIVHTKEYPVFMDTGTVELVSRITGSVAGGAPRPNILPHETDASVPLFPTSVDYIRAGEWTATIELASYTSEVRSGDDIHDEIAIEFEHDQGVDGAVKFVEAEEGGVAPGDVAASTVVVENTGQQEHTFFVGYEAVGPNGTAYDNDGTTGTTRSLEPGERGEIDLEWRVPEDAPEGQYHLVTAVWLESDRDGLQTRLDNDRRTDAINVVGTNRGWLHVDSIPSNASVVIDDDIEGDTPFTTELEAGTYDLAVNAPAYRARETQATVTAGQRTNVSVELEPQESDPPTAALSVAPTGATVGQQVSFDASDTTDPNGRELLYRWNVTNGTGFDAETVEPVIEWRFEEAGQYTITVQVDNGLETDSTQTTVAVTEPETSGKPRTDTESETETPTTERDATATDADGEETTHSAVSATERQATDPSTGMPTADPTAQPSEDSTERPVETPQTDATPEQRTLELISGETDLEYRIYVDGDAEISETRRAKAHNPDSIRREDGLTVIDDYSGHDSDWDGDAYVVRGEIVRIELEGDGQLAIDGETVDPRDVAQEVDIQRPEATQESTEERTLEVLSGETDVDYRIYVDGEAEITQTDRAKAHNPDSIIREDGLTVIDDYSSHDSDWDGDAYVIRGEITRIELEGDAQLAIDGEPVDPRDLTDDVAVQNVSSEVVAEP